MSNSVVPSCLNTNTGSNSLLELQKQPSVLSPSKSKINNCLLEKNNNASGSSDRNVNVVHNDNGDVRDQSESIIISAADQKADTKAAEAEVHSLSKRWTMWETPHGENNKESREVKTFASIEEFMPLFNGIPRRLSKLQRFVRVDGPPSASDTTNERLDAISFFPEGVIPTWADEAHKGGAMLQFLFKTDCPGRVVDELWERILCATLGKLLPEDIIGIRLTDCLPEVPNHACHAMPAVSVEVWHGQMATEAKVQFSEAVIDFVQQPLSCGGYLRLGRVRTGPTGSRMPLSYANHMVTLQNKLTKNPDEECRRWSV